MADNQTNVLKNMIKMAFDSDLNLEAWADTADGTEELLFDKPTDIDASQVDSMSIIRSKSEKLDNIVNHNENQTNIFKEIIQMSFDADFDMEVWADSWYGGLLILGDSPDDFDASAVDSISIYRSTNE